MRRRLLWALVVCSAFLALFSVQVQAIWPTVIIGGARLVTGAMGAARVYTLGEAAIAAAGEIANYLQLGPTAANIPLNPSLYNPPVPSGWMAAANPTQAPIPPSSAGSPQVIWHSEYGGSYGYDTLVSAQEACDHVATSMGWIPVSGHSVDACLTGSCFGNGAPKCIMMDNGSYYGGYPLSQQNVCPPGYTNNAGTCTLVTPSQVWYPSDTLCGVINAGGSFSLDPRDPDCYGAGSPAVTTSAPPATVPVAGQPVTISNPGPASGKTIVGSDPSGARVEVRTNADGSTTIITHTTSTTNNNNTVIRETTINNNYTVTNTTTSTVNTTGPSSWTYNVTIVNQPGTTTNTAASTVAVSNFPSDYAKDATVAAGNAKLAEIKTALTEVGASPLDPVPPTTNEVGALLMDSTFTSLKAWGLPSRSVSCPTAAFDLWSQHFVIDAHCTLWATVSTVVSNTMLLAWGLLALFVILGA